MPPQDEPPKAFRRRIRLEAPEEGRVFAALEDTAHHVRVALTHRDGKVASIAGEAVRLPWMTCPGAVDGLALLGGAEITTSLARLRPLFRPSSHCTHFFDLAHLAMAHGARGIPERSYEAIAVATGRTTEAQLRRDGQELLEWRVEIGRVVEPELFAGLGLGAGFVRWCSEHLDDDTAEAAFVLRRAASMSAVANMRMDDYAVVSESGLRPGTCFTAHADRIEVAFRNKGSQRDYSQDGAAMLAGFEEAKRHASAGGISPA